MDWTELIISVALEFAEKAQAIAHMVVPHGIYVEDYSDLEQGALEIAHIDLIDQDLIDKDRENVIIHIYISDDCYIETAEYIKERLSFNKIPFNITKNAVNDADWLDNWKKYFKATEIGTRLLVCPSWENCDGRNERTVLKIDPGVVFGTGTHATTRMCLEMMDRFISGGEEVLDIGCGSGIIAISAVLLGANNAVGVDIDATSIKVSKENASYNNVMNKTEFIEGDLCNSINGHFDIVVANIVADVIITLSAYIHKYMNKNGMFLCSGIIDSRAQEVVDAFNQSGFEIIETSVKDNWRAFVTRRREEEV